jgi:hypothetical protein
MCEGDKIESSEDLLHCMRQYLPQETKWQNPEKWHNFVASNLAGLTAALTGNGGGEPCYQCFFKSTLRYIAKTAAVLPSAQPLQHTPRSVSEFDGQLVSVHLR